MPPRTIFIGDIHGCLDETVALLSSLHPGPGDVVVSLGDLVRKGPASDRVLWLFRSSGHSAVLGNNDLELLARAKSPLARWTTFGPDGRVVRDVAMVAWLRERPLYLDFPDIGVVAVHAGILPNSNRFGPDLVPREAALSLRYVRRQSDGKWVRVPKGEQQQSDRFWSEVWNGDRTVVYGHTPRNEPRVDRRAIGLDTGCVYGGKLSAAVFDGSGRWTIEQVPARRRYAS